MLDVTCIPSELTIGKLSNSMSEAERYASREALVQSKYPPERHQGARRQTIRRSLPPSVPLRARNKAVAGNCSCFVCQGVQVEFRGQLQPRGEEFFARKLSLHSRSSPSVPSQTSSRWKSIHLRAGNRFSVASPQFQRDLADVADLLHWRHNKGGKTLPGWLSDDSQTATSRRAERLKGSEGNFA